MKVCKPQISRTHEIQNGHKYLAHTKWECKYHILFVSKYRGMVIYRDIKADIGLILELLCSRKGI